MKILFLTYYSNRGGSSRYMIHDYIDHFREAGFHFDVEPLLGDWYLKYLLEKGRNERSKLQLTKYVVFAYLKRLKALLNSRQYDLVYFDADLWPFLPYLVYKLTLQLPYIASFDEAIYSRYNNHKNPLIKFFNQKKIEKVMVQARYIVTWNPTVASYARSLNNNVIELGLGIDLARYRQKKWDIHSNHSDLNNLIQISWIGTPSGFNYLRYVDPVFRDLSKKYDITLRVISSKPYQIDGVKTINREWSLKTEVDDLLESHIGIMPLPETEWASGKSGCKMLQYMGVGIPAVVSPVGINAEVIENGQNGFLAGSLFEWSDILEKLILDNQLRRDVGLRGREYVENNNSLEKNAEVLIGMLKKICN